MCYPLASLYTHTTVLFADSKMSIKYSINQFSVKPVIDFEPSTKHYKRAHCSVERANIKMAEEEADNFGPVDEREEPKDELLIVRVQRYPILYDKGHKDWHVDSRKVAIWDAISLETGMPGNTNTVYSTYPLFSHCHDCNIKDKHVTMSDYVVDS